MERIISEYTMQEDRSIVYCGTFEHGEDVEINEGDYILAFHTCRSCKANLMLKVEKKILSYYFNDKPVYNYKVCGGGSYACNTKHVSRYDQISRRCDMS